MRVCIDLFHSLPPPHPHPLKGDHGGGGGGGGGGRADGIATFQPQTIPFFVVAGFRRKSREDNTAKRFKELGPMQQSFLQTNSSEIGH